MKNQTFDVYFQLKRRINTFVKRKYDWALYAKVDGHDEWVIDEWTDRPHIDTINRTIELFTRSISFYQSCQPKISSVKVKDVLIAPEDNTK